MQIDVLVVDFRGELSLEQAVSEAKTPILVQMLLCDLNVGVAFAGNS